MGHIPRIFVWAQIWMPECFKFRGLKTMEISVEPQIRKRSVRIVGHPTSISLEDPFWDALQCLAAKRGKTVRRIVEEIDSHRKARNLSSAIRVYLLSALRQGEAF